MTCSNFKIHRTLAISVFIALLVSGGCSDGQMQSENTGVGKELAPEEVADEEFVTVGTGVEEPDTIVDTAPPVNQEPQSPTVDLGTEIPVTEIEPVEEEPDTAGESTAAPDEPETVVVPPAVNPTPMVRAPDNLQTDINLATELEAQIILEGLPIAPPVIEWSQQSGPSTVLFSQTDSASINAQFNSAGIYVIRVSAQNGSFESSDTVTVTVVDNRVNQAPEVDVGPDADIDLGDVLSLDADVTDDGLPEGSLFYKWRLVSGPGSVTFGESTIEDTTATFSTSGDYVLELEVNDTDLITSDRIEVEVDSLPPVANNSNNANANAQWRTITTSDDSKPAGRHEAAAVAYQGQIYLLGGRSIRPTNRYNPSSNTWENLGNPPFEFSHFQPVVYDNKIYIVGALDCCFPSENVIPNVQIFNPANGQWSVGDAIPTNRLRGSAGTVVHNNRIYVIGGSTNGHDGGMVSWFDEYNPATGQWTTLPDAPNRRDHFSAVVVNNKLVVAAGRQTDWPATFQGLVSGVDIYDFATGVWSSGRVIPTSRAGALVVAYGDEAIVIGGEIASGGSALGVVGAYNVETNTWRNLQPLNMGRHSGGAAILGDTLHVISGNLTTGGGNETQTHESLELD